MKMIQGGMWRKEETRKPGSAVSRGLEESWLAREATHQEPEALVCLKDCHCCLSLGQSALNSKGVRATQPVRTARGAVGRAESPEGIWL